MLRHLVPNNKSPTSLRVTNNLSSMASRGGGAASGFSVANAVQACLLLAVLIFVTANFWMLRDLITTTAGNSATTTSGLPDLHLVSQLRKQQYRLSSSTFSSLQSSKDHRQQQQQQESHCSLRRYPPHRYYQWKPLQHDPQAVIASQPSFLTTDTEYIHGEWPIMLSPLTQDVDHDATLAMPTKICVDQSEWLQSSSSSKTLPFADGTNPSILTLNRIQEEAPRVAESILQHVPNAAYMVTVCMTNSQCTWKDTSQQVEQFRLSQQTEPDTVRTLLMLLDDQRQVLTQSTLYLHLDAPWGRQFRNVQSSAGAAAESFETHLPALDDARLFLHEGRVFVSYREGRGFGWDAQVLNPIHFNFAGSALSAQSSSSFLQVHLLASETSKFCCGRNMALMHDYDIDESIDDVTSLSLLSLTWVDPVTVITVDTTPLEVGASAASHRRRLKAEDKKKHKSHIHGTNAFMVPIPPPPGLVEEGQSNMEFLGVAHFHRPNDRNANPYARFGHHYTHAFYTVRRKSIDAAGNLQYDLTGLSAEFVLPAMEHEALSSSSSSQAAEGEGAGGGMVLFAHDAEIIQFISGLEYKAETQDVVLAYGINDCEAAITSVPLSRVQALLRPVPEGKQVIDYMKPLSVDGK